jgi:hypothetical protein
MSLLNEMAESKRRWAEFLFPTNKRSQLKSANLDLWDDQDLQNISLGVCEKAWAFNPIEYARMTADDLSREPRVRARLGELTGLQEEEKRELLETLAWALFATCLTGCSINP